MGTVTGTFSLLSWAFLLGAGFTIYQVGQHRAELWDKRLTTRVRQMGASVAFFLLVPVAVLLHELGHMLAAWSTGSQVLGLHYFGYWGYVELLPSSAGATLAWYIALAGNFVTFLVGVVCLAGALWLGELRPVVRVVLAQLGVLELLQTLIAYPLMSLAPDFHGDWDTIYSFQAPLASWTTLVVHITALVVFAVLLQRSKRVRYLLSGA